MATSLLCRGMNLWGFQGSVNMQEGEASVCQDILFRPDGAMFKSWGTRRISATALANPILAHRGFAYKGKNTLNAADPAVKPGNFSLANDGAQFTRRAAFYSTGIALCDDGLYYWDPAAGAFAGPIAAFDGGAAINPIAGGNPRPTICVQQNNAYITGWAEENVRYDPVERACYRWGWVDPPVAPALAPNASGVGLLLEGRTYRYRFSWLDLYTGEESRLSDPVEQVLAAGNDGFTIGAIARFNDPNYHRRAAVQQDDDIAVVVYRTDADGHAYYFSQLLYPSGGGVGLPDYTAGANLDEGALDYTIKGDVREFENPPVLNTQTFYRGMWYGLSWDNNWARFYYNDFRAEKSFFERTDPRDYREVPVEEGDFLTSIADTPNALILFGNDSAYSISPMPDFGTGQIQMGPINPLKWPVGCVGPRAWTYAENGLYFLSERGPYRFQNGVLEFIGKNVQPMFLDPQSGLCQLNEQARVRATVGYNQDAELVHFAFTCGGGTFNNRHIYYYLRGQEVGNQYWQGWCYGSPRAQDFDSSHVYEELIAGVPVTPFQKRERFIFSDDLGFLYEYVIDYERMGLNPAQVATGVADAASTVNLLVTGGGLYVAGDGLEGLRLEVVHTNGTIDVRTVAANTAVNITPDVPFTQEPDGATWYVGGIPAYWRSWYDHAGDPSIHKTWFHHVIGFSPTEAVDNNVVDVTLYKGDFPRVMEQARTALLTAYRRKVMPSLTARFFAWEIANSRPDETFAITYFKNEYQPSSERQP